MVEGVWRPGCFGTVERSVGTLRDDTKDEGEVGLSFVDGTIPSDDFVVFRDAFCRPSCEPLVEFWLSDSSLRRPPLGVAEV